MPQCTIISTKSSANTKCTTSPIITWNTLSPQCPRTNNPPQPTRFVTCPHRLHHRPINIYRRTRRTINTISIIIISRRTITSPRFPPRSYPALVTCPDRTHRSSPQTRCATRSRSSTRRSGLFPCRPLLVWPPLPSRLQSAPSNIATVRRRPRTLGTTTITATTAVICRPPHRRPPTALARIRCISRRTTWAAAP